MRRWRKRREEAVQAVSDPWGTPAVEELAGPAPVEDEPEPEAAPEFDSLGHHYAQVRAWEAIQRANGDYHRRPPRRTERV